MKYMGAVAEWSAVATAVAVLAVSPAIGASGGNASVTAGFGGSKAGFSSFTPASADPRLAAAFARSNVATSGFKFTPASAAGRPSRAVTVAVRARSTITPATVDRPLVAATALNVAPFAYNLGVSVGWKRFAISGDIAQTDSGALQGGRRGVDVGVSYTMKKWATRVQLAADRPAGNAPRAITAGESVAVDFGGSYRLTRNLDLTAGVRYKSERDRLEPLADTRRDSQAVYIGTAFKF